MKDWVNSLYRQTRYGPPVIVVSGLPRSGTSMAMQMLQAGGLPIFSDGMRQADEDNPQGYFECEKIKSLGKDPDPSWLLHARGHGLKVISHLLRALPKHCCYRVVFVNRDLDEVIASQNKMLLRLGQCLAPDDARLRLLFSRHLRQVKSWMARQQNFQTLELDYRQVVADPLANARHIRNYLGLPLDLMEMASAVDTSLYRNRHQQPG